MESENQIVISIIKRSFIIALFCGLISCSQLQNKINNKSNKVVKLSTKNEYKLVWSDEFDEQGKPDTNKWVYDIGGNRWGNSELQYYSSQSENVRVENGKLIIEARNYRGQKIKYTSARIKTKGNGDWLYGRVEVKAKIPTGKGTWPAIWMLPTENKYGNWPASGEIDIMEHVGFEPNVIHGTVHTKKFNHTLGTQKGAEISVSTATTAFHIYSIEWDKNKIDFFVDDEKYFTFTNQHKSYKEWPFDQKFFLIINLAIGGNWGGLKGVDDTIFPARMIIDYVRIYKK